MGRQRALFCGAALVSTALRLPELLSLAAEVVASVMDSARPSDDTVDCPMCHEKATAARDHAADCAYRIARTQITPEDLKRLRRLARAIGDEW